MISLASLLRAVPVRAVVLSFALVSSVAIAAPPVAPPGRAGVTESVEQIMARSRAADARAAAEGRKPHVKTEREVERDELPQDPDALAIPSYGAIDAARDAGPRIQSTGTSAPQSVTTNFLGATLADTGAFPPDSMGAAGPTQFVVAVNGRIRTFSKATGAPDGALDADMDAFFDAVMTPPTSNNFTSDPHVRYDRLSGRWFVVLIDVPGMDGATPNRVMLAVSSGPTITSASSFTFFYYRHDQVAPAGDAAKFADYPTLGIDAKALYIGDNVFDSSGAFAGCSAFVVQKSSILGAGPMVVNAFRGLVPTASSDGPYTPQGVDNYDPAATEGYFIGVSNSAFGRLILRRVSNPGSASPTISANLSITVPTTGYPANVPHLGNTGATAGYLDGLDDRLFAAHLRNGRLWTAHNIQVNATGTASGMGGRNGTRWYELQNVAPGQTPTLRQSGTLFDNAASTPVSYFIPSVMVSGQGHAAFGFTNAGAANRINAGTAGRLSGDTLGTLQAPALYTASSTAYNPPADTGANNGSRRWGDYSYTSLDPVDDMTMWTIAEFNNATNTYGVQIAKLVAPPPATPAAASTSIAQGAANVNVTITGASVNGSGFYDPGANPAGNAFNHIAASVSGTGITVNGVTYTSPTSITLNLSAAAGAAIGARNITVTNPDGQSRTGAGVLNVTPGAVNLPPTLDIGKSPMLVTESEDAPAPVGATGSPVSSLVDLTSVPGGLDNVSDPDAGAVTGMAVIAADTTYGAWFYTLDGGAAWTAVPAVSASSALLLPASAGARVYFRPNANFNGVSALTFLAWDQTTGTAGATMTTAGAGTGTSTFSATSDVATVTVLGVNDAPTATNLSASENYSEDSPLNLIDIFASDVDNTALTATLTLSNPAAGALSTATAGATTSTYNPGTGVWTANGVNDEVNTLLAGVVFTPAPNFNASFGIATSISDGVAAATGTKLVTGNAVNDAPVLDASASPALGAIGDHAPVPSGAVGTLVATLVDFAAPAGGLDNVIDIDAGAQLGIAAVAADAANGAWFYSANNGTTWMPMGAVSDANARLLAADAGTRVYFRPTSGFTGAIPAALTFRAWDQSSGANGGMSSSSTNGGTTAFSSATDTASILVVLGDDLFKDGFE